eukprot:6201372-Pleurochrysis_carterae.AAC.2
MVLSWEPEKLNPISIWLRSFRLCSRCVGGFSACSPWSADSALLVRCVIEFAVSFATTIIQAACRSVCLSLLVCVDQSSLATSQTEPPGSIQLRRASSSANSNPLCGDCALFPAYLSKVDH